MIEFRKIHPKTDRDLVQEMFLGRAFEHAPYEARRPGLNQFKDTWLNSSSTQALLNAFEASLKDPRTIAEVVMVGGVEAGVLWVTMQDEPGEPPFAELRLLGFHLSFQRQGLGRTALAHIEELLIERGAVLLRSEGNAPSDGVRHFHESVGFEAVKTVFEKRLGRPD